MAKHLGDGEITVNSKDSCTYAKSPATTGKKNYHVQSLRGLAIILVVLGHIIGSDNSGGMKVSDDSIFRYLYYTLEYIRMPLFTVISGWVYANKPVISEHRFKFIKGKLRRLIIPMFVISTILFLSRIMIPYANEAPRLEDLGYNLFFPYDLYWYLYSLFLIFLIISVLDTQPFFRTIKGWALSLIAAFGILFVEMQFLNHLPNLFSWMGAAYLLPFFLIGIGV
ncbi:MAG: acyltransferase [Bacteroidetes bacterium]|nr:acyltransferase [Bacteroidota bacterium]